MLCAWFVLYRSTELLVAYIISYGVVGHCWIFWSLVVGTCLLSDADAACCRRYRTLPVLACCRTRTLLDAEQCFVAGVSVLLVSVVDVLAVNSWCRSWVAAVTVTVANGCSYWLPLGDTSNIN